MQEPKSHHIEEGHAWTTHLARASRPCTAAAKRGLGPPRKDAEIGLETVAQMSDDAMPAAAGGPFYCKRSWIISSFWLLREIELAGICIQTSHITVGPDWAQICLPASKTDVGGIGKKRLLRCICHIGRISDGNVTGKDMCPVCAAKKQLEFALSCFNAAQMREEVFEATVVPRCARHCTHQECRRCVVAEVVQ